MEKFKHYLKMATKNNWWKAGKISSKHQVK